MPENTSQLSANELSEFQNSTARTEIPGSPRPRRNPALDRMKGFLVIGMVLSHTLNFYPVFPFSFCSAFSTYISTMTFPGFLFVLGYVSQIAYFSKERPAVSKHILSGFFKSLAALYICGIAFTLFMQKNVSIQAIIDKILLRELPSYSEFLLSFALLYLTMYLFFPFIKKMSDRAIVILSIFSLGMTFFPYHLITHPIPASIFGCETMCTFPLIPYGIYFLAGIYFCRHKVVFHKWLYPATLLCTFCFAAYHLILQRGPVLFPPTFIRVLGTTGIIYTYYLIARKSFGTYGDALLTFIGRHTLIILVIHNLLLFFSSCLLTALR